jgi:hypothetical protein
MCVCMCVYAYYNIIYATVAIHQLSRAPRRKAWLKYYYCYETRSRFSPVDVSSIVVPVRIIVIIKCIYIYITVCVCMYKSFLPLTCSRSIRFIVYLWLYVFFAMPPRRSFRKIKTEPITWFPTCEKVCDRCTCRYTHISHILKY